MLVQHAAWDYQAVGQEPLVPTSLGMLQHHPAPDAMTSHIRIRWEG